MVAIENRPKSSKISNIFILRIYLKSKFTIKSSKKDKKGGRANDDIVIVK